MAFTEVIPGGGTVVLAAEEHGPVHVQVGQEVVNMLLYHLRKLVCRYFNDSSANNDNLTLQLCSE